MENGEYASLENSRASDANPYTKIQNDAGKAVSMYGAHGEDVYEAIHNNQFTNAAYENDVESAKAAAKIGRFPSRNAPQAPPPRAPVRQDKEIRESQAIYIEPVSDI